MSTEIPYLTLLNTPVHVISAEDMLHHVRRFMNGPRLRQIITTNPEFVMIAQTDPEFLRVLKEADLCIADGIGVVWASRWLGKPLPERIPGSEMIYRMSAMAAEEDWRLFLLGAAPGVAEEAAAVFQARYPRLRIAGTFAGSPEPIEDEATVRQINESRANMLFVAYGAPAQDKWIARNRERLETVRVAMGVGGAFDFVVGRANRAPQWVQRFGLEWLHRLIREPWRWRRMLRLPRFAVRVLLTSRRSPQS